MSSPERRVSGMLIRMYIVIKCYCCCSIRDHRKEGLDQGIFVLLVYSPFLSEHGFYHLLIS